MGKSYPYELMDSPQQLAKLKEWSEEVYQDMFSLREGSLSEADFWAKYGTRVAIVCLDMTGFTETAIRYGELSSLLRIFDVHRVCAPIFQHHKAKLMRAFADDLTAIFDDPHRALDAALEIHARIRLFNQSPQASAHPTDCCIGIGYGDVLAIGPNAAMGDEMNRSSKLGEDTARAYEILITQNTYEALRDRTDCAFTRVSADDLPFEYYSVQRLEK